MASLAGPAGLLKGLVQGEQRRRERELQDEELRRQQQQRDRQRKLERLQLLLRATENPAIVPRGQASGGERRESGPGPAGTRVIGRGPSESTAPSSPMTESAPLLGLADRARRGEAPGQPNEPAGSALEVASRVAGGGGPREGRERGGRRVMGLGPMNDLLGRSGEEAFVFDPSRTDRAKEADRSTELVEDVIDRSPFFDESDREMLASQDVNTLESLMAESVQEQQRREREKEQARQQEVEDRKEERREALRERALDLAVRYGRQGESFEGAIQQIRQAGLTRLVRESEMVNAYQNGRQLLDPGGGLSEQQKAEAENMAAERAAEDGIDTAVEDLRSKEERTPVENAALTELLRMRADSIQADMQGGGSSGSETPEGIDLFGDAGDTGGGQGAARDSLLSVLAGPESLG